MRRFLETGVRAIEKQSCSAADRIDQEIGEPVAVDIGERATRRPLVGAGVMVILPEFLRQMGAGNADAARLRTMIVGAFLITIIHFRSRITNNVSQF